MIPVNFQVEPQFLPQVMGSEAAHVERNFFEEVKPALKKASIPYVDLMSMMQQHPEQKYFPRDGEVHFNANGHAFAARALKQAIDQEHLLE